MRSPAHGLGVVALALFAACAVPTELPTYDTVWNVPVKSTTISVNSFLPAGEVTATPDNSAFQVTVSPSSTGITRSLGQDCSACVVANGFTVPKPPFSGGGTASLGLPSNVSTVTLVRDTLTVSITNGFNFDPIRPSAGARGYFTITVTSGANVVGRDSVDGSTTALAANSTLVRRIPLAGTVSGSGGLQVTSQLNSPLGDPVTIDVSRQISLSASVGTVYVSSAQVSLANQNVSSPPTEMDLSGIDSTIVRRANGASLLLAVDNPFNATGTLKVDLVGGSTITKSIVLTGGSSTPSVDFTGDEIRALLGQKVSVTFSGAVNGANVTIQPGQSLSVTSRLQLSLTVGKL